MMQEGAGYGAEGSPADIATAFITAENVVNDHSTFPERIAQARRALDESRYADADMLAQQVIHAAAAQQLLAEALEIAGFAAHHDARYVDARLLAERARALFYEQGDRAGQARVLHLLGVLHRELNDLASALDYHHQQAVMAETIGDQAELMRAWNGIAGVYQFSGDYPSALTHAQRALDLAQQMGDLSHYIAISSNILQIYVSIDNKTDGDALIATTQSVIDNVAHKASPTHVAHFYTRTARYYLHASDLDRAAEYNARALHMTEQHQLRRHRAVALGDTADILIARGQYGAAIAPLIEAWEIAVSYNFLSWMDSVLLSLVHVHERMGDYQGAFLWHTRLHAQKLSVLDAERHRAVRQTEARYHVEAARNQAEQFREQANYAETQRQSLERLNRLKDDLLATATHDIKNPLTSIRLTLDMIRRTDIDRDRLNQHIAHIDMQVMRITRLIASLLDLAKLETGTALELTPIRALDLLAWAAGQFMLPASARNIRLHILPTDSTLYMIADRERLERVLDNLMSNAIKYTPPEGSVTLHISPVDDGVQISVSDTGLGIPETDLQNILAPFFRVQRDEHLAVEGTGLGLAIVHTFLQQHGSTLHVESKLGEGSRFSFKLPRSSLTAL
jgi:signal transduction histidine kinase